MSSLPSLLRPEPTPRYTKYFKYGTLILIVALVLTLVFWLLFRFHSEESTAATFMNDVIAGHYEKAYGMWSKTSTYQYKDFLQDWGPKGYYGPVRSFRIVAAHKLHGASGVIIVVDVSPFHPFPSEDDFEKARETKEVRLWIQFSTHSISYAPSFG
jgi:hypothetical protein